MSDIDEINRRSMERREAKIISEQAARIQQLEAALEWIVGTALTEPEAMVEKARAALEERT